MFREIECEMPECLRKIASDGQSSSRAFASYKSTVEAFGEPAVDPEQGDREPSVISDTWFGAEVIRGTVKARPWTSRVGCGPWASNGSETAFRENASCASCQVEHFAIGQRDAVRRRRSRLRPRFQAIDKSPVGAPLRRDL